MLVLCFRFPDWNREGENPRFFLAPKVGKGPPTDGVAIKIHKFFLKQFQI